MISDDVEMVFLLNNLEKIAHILVFNRKDAAALLANQVMMGAVREKLINSRACSHIRDRYFSVLYQPLEGAVYSGWVYRGKPQSQLLVNLVRS